MNKIFTTQEEIACELARQIAESDCSEDEHGTEVDEDAFEIDSDGSLGDPDYECNSSDVDVEEIVKTAARKPKVLPQPSTSKCRPRKRASSSTNKSGPCRKKKKTNQPDEETLTVTKVIPPNDTKIGRNGFVWKTSPIPKTNGKTAGRNIVHTNRRTKNQALDISEPVECFEAFVTPAMQNLIVTHTNSEISSQRETYKNQELSALKNLCLVELRALLGLTIRAGAMKDNHLKIETLHDPVQCGNKYNATLSAKRHQFLLNTLRFDSRETRAERQSQDKFAPIREIWDILIEQCKTLYEPSPYLTIDEQLVPFRGRVGFKMYIPNKPSKYGIKIVMCDTGTHYMLNAIPYLGKGSTPENKSAAHHFIESLTQDIRHSGRNLTYDNWFTSVPVALKLAEQGLTMIGTIRKNKPELPKQFVDSKYMGRPPQSSMFLFHDSLTAVSYCPRKNNLVSLISTTHDDDAINEHNSKPEIVLCYNQTKGAVDSFDQCVSATSCIRKTKRWPMNQFYNMLNIACYNAYVVYLLNFHKKSKDSSKALSRFDFLITLADQLTFPWMKKRLELRIPHALRSSISTCLGFENVTTEDSERLPASSRTRQYCSYCSYKKKRMSKIICHTCKKPVCGDHCFKVCVTCMNP